jgi:hypothetical protein
LRNGLNNTINQGRKIKWRTSETIEAYKKEDYKTAMSSGKLAVGGVLGVVAISALSQTINDIIRGEDNPVSGIAGGHFDFSDAQGVQSAADYMSGWLMDAPFRHAVTSAPFIRDIDYAVNAPNRSKVKTVTLPITKIMSDFATARASLPALLDADRDLSKGEMKAWLFSASYLLLPLPVNGVYKARKFFEGQSENVEKVTQTAENISKSINAYLNKPPNDEISDELKAELKALDEGLRPQDASAAIPTDTYDVFKKMESGGDWKKVSENGAAGIYQFTPEQWNDIARQAPELGLTDNGRVSKSPEQQEAAMRWLNERNAQELTAAELPIDKETLYAAKVLGAEAGIKLYQTAGNTKVKAIGQLPAPYDTYKTVGQVRKAIKSKVKDNELTLSAKETED